MPRLNFHNRTPPLGGSPFSIIQSRFSSATRKILRRHSVSAHKVFCVSICANRSTFKDFISADKSVTRRAEFEIFDVVTDVPAQSAKIKGEFQKTI